MSAPAPLPAGGRQDDAIDPVPDLVDQYFSMIDAVNASEDQQCADRIFAEEEAVSARIVEMVATSPGGVLAQLRMLREIVEIGNVWSDSRDVRLLASIEAGVERVTKGDAPGGHPASDAEILTMFRRWIELHRAQSMIGEETPEIDLQDIPEWVASEEVIDELEDAIAEFTVAGAIGLAVKGYIAAFRYQGASNKDAAALCGGWGEIGVCEGGFLLDATRFVPEIADLIKWVLVEEDRH